MLEIKFDNVAIDSNGIKGLSNTYELYKDNFYLGAVASNTFKLEVAKHLMPSKPTEVKIEDDNNNYVLEVDKIEETDNSYEIELTDKMLRFNFLYDAKPLIDENRVDGESTTTIQDILNDICEKADIECNYTLTTANHIVDWWDNRISARDYISMIAEKEATFVRFENDELMFIPVNSPSKKTINEDEIDELKIGEGRKITRVVYDNGVGTFWEFGDESGNTLYLDPNNVFILDEDDVEDIYNKIKDFEFYSITVGNCPIDSSVLAGDVIKFKDRNDNEYPTIAQYNLSYFGKWLGGYSLDIKSTTQEETSVLGVFDSVKSIRTEIDRTNNELKIIAEEVGENSSKISTMEQTVDGFTQTVQKVETLETQVSDLENDIDNIELQRPFYRYSANSDGSNMTESPQANTKYLGTYVGVEASSDPTDYTWTLIKGADGEKGADGTDGKDGKDGKGITATVIRYQLHTNGTTAPTGSWLSTIPTPEQGKYLWTRTTVTYTDTSEVDTYSVSYFATDGQKGTDGTGIVSTEVRYQIGTSGTVAPTGTWVVNPPAPQKGKYLWTRTIITYSDDTTSTSYSTSYYALDGEKGQDGASGEDGKTLFLAYADNIDDYEGFSTDGADSNKDYYGMFVGHEQSLDPLDYEWYPSNYKIESDLDLLNYDLDYTKERVDKAEDDADEALKGIKYQEDKTNTLEQSLESVKTSMSYSGGYNLIENCIKQFGQKGWEGSFFNLTNTEIKENSLTKSALVFTNDIEVREIQTENRVHNFSFKYKKLISPANVKITINGIEILLDKHNEWTIVDVNIPVVDNLVVIKYESDTDHSAWLVDILLIPGDIRQIYTPHPSELYTDEYEMGGGKFKLKSSDQNVFFEASADGIRTRNTVTNLVTSEFTEDGMYNKKSTSDEGDIAKVMIVNIGNQTWFKRR